MNKKSYVLPLVGLVLILAVSACGSGFNMANDSSPEYGGDERLVLHMTSSGRPASPGNVAMAPPMADMPASAPDGSPFVGSGAADVTWEDIYEQNERHVIRRASLNMTSETFDDTVAALRAVAPAVNGYVESEVLTGTGTRRLTIVLRVPVATFDVALGHVEALGDVYYQNQSAQDVTAQFYDLAGNLETRRIEEERILNLIERANDIHELLALEARLSNVRQTIASYLAQLNQMAGLVSYSTITVTLAEYNPFRPAAGPTLGSRIGGAFGDSVDGTVSALQGIVVLLAGAILPLALLAIVGFVIWRIIKTVKKRVAHT